MDTGKIWDNGKQMKLDTQDMSELSKYLCPQPAVAASGIINTKVLLRYY